MAKHDNVYYFHGLPGSPRELALFDAPSASHWHAPDRGALEAGLCVAEHFDQLASDVRARYRDKPVRLVGFSLGAYVALEVAARLPDMSIEIDLVSAAAPIVGNTHLDRMAGKTVFSLAGRHPFLFLLLTYGQALAARVAPTGLCNMLFASAQGDDTLLRDDAVFRRRMAFIVAECLAKDTRNYRREVRAYTSNWTGVLKSVRHPVALWHGQKDNWTPPEMAEDLAKALPNVTAVHRLKGKSHYSTLEAYQLESDTPRTAAP